jgi:hypothetical protein
MFRALEAISSPGIIDRKLKFALEIDRSEKILSKTYKYLQRELNLSVLRDIVAKLSCS